MGKIADGIKQYGTQQIQKDNAESDYLKTLVQDTSDFLSDFDDGVQNTVSDILPEVWVDPVETQTTPEEDDYLAHLRQQHPDATDSELRGKSVRNTFNKTEQSARSITGNIALGALNAVSTTDRVKGLDYDYIERASNPYTLDPALLSGSAAPNSEAIVARYEGLEKGDYESFSDEDKTFWNGPQAQLIRRIDANKKQHGEIKKSIEDYKTEADEYVIHTLQDYRNDEEFQKTYEEHGGGMEGLLHGLLNEAINDPAKMPVAFIENLPYMIGFAYGGAPVVATLASQKDEENVARFQEEKGRAPTTAERTRLLVDSVGSILMERFGDKYVLRGKAAGAFRKINEVLPGVSRVVGGTVTEGISGGGSEAFDQDAIKQDVTKLDTFKIAKAAKEEALVGAGGGGIATVANNLESTAKYALEDEDRIPDTLRNMGVPIPEMKKQMIMGDKTLKSMPKPDLVQQSWRATAEDMDKKDVPMQEIWEKTGFMKKEDGKWRFEVDDAGAELTAEGLSVVKRRAHNANMHDYKLGNLLKHDKMYEVAPSLKDTRVRFYSGKSNSRGYYLSDNDTLYLNLNRFSAPTSGMVADDVIDLEERIENLKADPKSSDKAFPAGLKSWETNEKQVEELEKRLDKRRKAMRTRSDADLGVLLHEVQHAVQQREGFARGGSPTEFMAEITVEKMGEMYPDRDFSEESALEALNELPYEQRKELLEEIEKESEHRYHRLLGEQESNETGMTEKEGGRRGMTPEQLKGTMPGEMGTNNTYWQEPIVKDAEGPRWKMDNTQPSSMWDDKIERRIKVMFPKDERGKYIPEERLTKEEYAEFQKAQHRLEVQARMDMEEEIALRIKDATEHEGAMQSIEYGGETITDPMFIQNEEHFKEKKKALLDIINNPSTDPTSFEKARNYLFKLEDKAEQLGYKIGKKQMSEDYRGSHTAPVPEGKNSLDDFSEAMPDSPNDPNFLRYYGMGGEYAAADAETLAAMKKAAGNPDAEITVYRATPNADKSINAGDWVSTSKKYAEQHGERYLEGGYDIAQRTVKASELHTDGDLHEWGYNPKETTTDDAYKAEFDKHAKKNQDYLNSMLDAEIDPETRAELNANKAEAKKKGRAAREAIEDAKPQAEVDTAGFISKAEQVTKLLSQENNPANYVEKYLRKKGVTDTELEDTGLAAMLRDKLSKNENVTRAEVLEHINDNKPVQDEVVLTGDSKDASWVGELHNWQSTRGIPDTSMDITIGDAEITVTQDENGEYHATPTGHPGADNEILNPGVRSINETVTQLRGHFRNAPQGDTKHSSATQPGLDPSTYEEYYITSDMVAHRGGFSNTAHHGNIEDVVFHIRTSTRTDDAGNQVLFIEELQSDLHQKGRQKEHGYRDKSSDAYQAGLEPLAKVGRELYNKQQGLIASEQDKISKHFEETGELLIPTKIHPTRGEIAETFDLGQTKKAFENNEKRIAELLERIAKYEGYIRDKNPKYDLKAVELHLSRDKDVLENIERHRSVFMSNVARENVEKSHPELTKRLADKNKEIQEFKREFNAAVPNAPLKNDKWIQAGLEKAIEIARTKGLDRVAWTTSQQQVNTWNRDAVKLYEAVYDNKLPGAARSLASQFKAKAGKTEMTFTDEEGQSNHANVNYIDISPELAKKVGKGINSYAKGGLVTNNPAERKQAHQDYLKTLVE